MAIFNRTSIPSRTQNAGILLCAGILFSVALNPGSAIAADKKGDADFEKQMENYLSQDKNIEKVAGALQRFFEGKKAQQEKDMAAEESKRVEEQFKNPVKVDIGSSPTKGKSDAKITIVEFSDFQCPFCMRGYKVMEDVLKEYPNDVRLVFKNLPLEIHNQAEPAARATLAAGEQGKFWEMHDAFFNNQRELGRGEQFFVETAGKLGLDVEKFKADFASDAIAKRVADDVALANSIGVQGTPGFFVNGVSVQGAQPLPVFKKLIERWKSQQK